MDKKIYVTGVGAVSAIGLNADENYTSLSRGLHGIGKLTLFESIYGLPVGEVKIKSIEGLSRTAQLGLIAAKEAVADSNITEEDIQENKIRVGIISSTTVGGMDITERIYPVENPSEMKNNLAQHPCAYSTEYIAGHLGIGLYSATLSTACSSAANAIIVAEKLIRNNILDCVIAGGCDSLCKFTYNGFNSLKILSGEHCKPFDDNRNGLNLGEGAGYMVLQNARTLKRTPYCTLSGCANANDAFHQTASSPEGEGGYLAMTQALAKAGLNPGDIDYINVHGTGTPNNDSSEFAAMKRIWGDSFPPFSSTKCYTGHTLAAAGGLEAVFSVLSIKNGAIYANLNCTSCNGISPHSPCTEFIEGAEIKNVLSNSFGFGGNTSTLVFSKI